MDDVVFYADTEDELLDTIDEILARLESVGLFAAAHKCTFFSREIAVSYTHLTLPTIYSV